MALVLSHLPNTYRGHFPHMSAGDRPIWLRYLDQHAGEWDTFAYDVAVGGQEAPPQVKDAEIRRAWRFNTSKRIDVLGFASARIGLFEIRPQAGVAAIGSLVSYEVLLREELTDARPIVRYLVTDVMAPDTERVCRSERITCVVLPAG